MAYSSSGTRAKVQCRANGQLSAALFSRPDDISRPTASSHAQWLEPACRTAALSIVDPERAKKAAREAGVAALLAEDLSQNC